MDNNELNTNRNASENTDQHIDPINNGVGAETGNAKQQDAEQNNTECNGVNNNYNSDHSYNTINSNNCNQKENGDFNTDKSQVVFGNPSVDPNAFSGRQENYQFRNQSYNENGNYSYSRAGQYNTASNGFGSNNYSGYGSEYHAYNNGQAGAKAKKPKTSASKGFVALMVCIGIVLSGIVGYVSSALAQSHASNFTSKGTGSDISINYVDPTSSTSKEETNAAHVNNVAGQAVVEISTESVTTSVFYGQYITQGAGSGVIIASSDGKSYILTCAHVVSDASKLLVTLNNTNKDQFEATIVGSDSITDIAVISIDVDGLTTATIGDYDSVEVGDYVVAIGNPLGSLGGSVTDGIISALDRSIIIDGQTYTLIQTNASINPGNSGGGLFDKDGNLIGVVNAKSSSDSSGTQIEGIGFAIPIKKAMQVAEELIKNGYVTGRVQLGLSLFEIESQNDYYTYWNYQRYITGYGVYVAESQSDNFQMGDRIAAIDGVEISSVSEIKNLLLDYSVGDVVKVSVYRIDMSGKSRLIEIEHTLTEKNS